MLNISLQTQLQLVCSNATVINLVMAKSISIAETRLLLQSVITCFGTHFNPFSVKNMLNYVYIIFLKITCKE